MDSPPVLLDDVRTFIGRFCAFPDEHCLNAVTLWAAHTHMVEFFYTTPRLALLSPEPSSGKTRVLDVLDLLVPEPMYSFGASPAAIFRRLADRQVTVLFDEVDTIWSSKGKNDNNEDLRGLLNVGYKRGAKVPRCVGPNHQVVDFDVYSAVALAGIGELPDTIMTRSVIIKMRRRGPGEHVEQFRTRMHAPEGAILQGRLAGWASEVGEQAGAEIPEMPNGVEDRPAEVWESLLAVADAAGGPWPDIARKACVHLVEVAKDRKVSLGIRLLEDLRTLFSRANADKLSTAYLLEMLCSDHSGLADDAPWGEILHGSAINARKLASLLKPYGISSKKVRIDETTQQGYAKEDLYDAWQRYLSQDPAEVEHPEQTEQIPRINGLGSTNVPHVPDVPGHAPPYRRSILNNDLPIRRGAKECSKAALTPPSTGSFTTLTARLFSSTTPVCGTWILSGTPRRKLSFGN